jgi:hypothetical protein
VYDQNFLFVKANLVCDICQAYLIRDNRIQIPNKKQKEVEDQLEAFTLKDVFNNESLKDDCAINNCYEDVNKLLDEPEIMPTMPVNISDNLVKNPDESTSSRNTDFDDLLKHSHTITKSEIDAIVVCSKQLDNNLKLFFLMNISDEDEQQDNCEKFVSKFLLKLYLLNDKSSTNIYLTNCLCIITNKNLFIFNIIDKNL